MGQELYRRSGNPASPLRSAQVMLDRPELFVAVHCDYIPWESKIENASRPVISTMGGDLSRLRSSSKADKT